jgi:hypothetical protein
MEKSECGEGQKDTKFDKSIEMTCCRSTWKSWAKNQGDMLGTFLSPAMTTETKRRMTMSLWPMQPVWHLQLVSLNDTISE